MSAPDVDRMGRMKLVNHVKDCTKCSVDDPDGKGVRVAHIDDARSYVQTAHDERWLEIVKGAKS